MNDKQKHDTNIIEKVVLKTKSSSNFRKTKFQSKTFSLFSF